MNFENVQNKRRLRLEPECHGYFQRKIAEFSEYFWSVNLSDSQVTIYISELSDFFKIYWPENIKDFGYIFLWLLAECFHWNSTFNSWNSKNVLCSKKHFKKCTFCLCFKIQSIFFQELITLIWQKLLNHSRAILKYLLKILTTLLNGPSLSCICFNLIHFMQGCSVNKQYIVIKRRRK